MEHWFRSHHGAPTDPKWLVIARKAGHGVVPGMVASIWWALMDHASQQVPRGSIVGFDPESVAAFFGYEDGLVVAVLEAMEGRGMIADGRLVRWDRRQPKREREDDSAERVRAYRVRQKAGDSASTRVSDSPPAATGGDTADVTPCNASASHATPRGEEIREEENEPPLAPPAGGVQSPSGGRRQRTAGRPLPAEWKPGPDHFTFGAERGLTRRTVEDQADAMREWAKANDGRQVTRKSDWDATFRTWLRRYAESRPAALKAAGPELPGAARTPSGTPTAPDLLRASIERFNQERAPPVIERKAS